MVDSLETIKVQVLFNFKKDKKHLYTVHEI